MLEFLQPEHSDEAELCGERHVAVHVLAHWFPVVCGMATFGCFVSGYALSASAGRSTPFLPYISDGGAFPPESGVFGLLLSCAGFFWICTAFCVHILLNTHVRTVYGQYPLAFKVALLFMSISGVTSGVGLIMVASFQNAHMRQFHWAGAALAFIFGILFTWSHTIITLSLRQRPVKRWLIYMRFFLVVGATVSLSMFIYGSLMRIKVNGTMQRKPNAPDGQLLKMPVTSPFYMPYMIGTSSEWVMGMCLALLASSFTYELNKMELRAHRLTKSCRESISAGETCPVQHSNE